eukprot:s4764_g1.t1
MCFCTLPRRSLTQPHWHGCAIRDRTRGGHRGVEFSALEGHQQPPGAKAWQGVVIADFAQPSFHFGASGGTGVPGSLKNKIAAPY